MVATPIGEDETAWWLTDRSGRPLGAIRTIPGVKQSHDRVGNRKPPLRCARSPRLLMRL